MAGLLFPFPFPFLFIFLLPTYLLQVGSFFFANWFHANAAFAITKISPAHTLVIVSGPPFFFLLPFLGDSSSLFILDHFLHQDSRLLLSGIGE